MLGLIILSLLVAGVGGLMLSNATAGVGVICGACLLAIYARIAQAAGNTAELEAIRTELKKLNEREERRAAGWQSVPMDQGRR